MVGEFSAEGSGVHPGKPIIWPTGKASSSQVNSAQQAQTTGNVAPGVSTGKVGPTKPGEVAPTTPTQPGAPAAPAKPAPNVARPLTVADIRAHLVNIQIPPTDANTKLASLMLKNGVELSRSNFIKLVNMLQGSNKSQGMQEAAVLLLMKGIDSPQAAKILGQYFSNNPGLASELIALQNSLGNLLSALGMSKGLLDANLISQLGALLSQVDETFKSLTENSGKSVSNQILLNDMRALKALIQGVQDKSNGSNSAEAQAVSSSLIEFQGKLDAVLQNLLAQSILSQQGRSEVDYHYQQIPNAMTNPPKDFEIVIKRDGSSEKAAIDPNNTQVVMSMETESMGKIVVTMLVKDKKVYVIFLFSEKDYGNNGRALIAKEFGGLQQKLVAKNYMLTGYQVKVDTAMCNIRPYLIPLIPRLEELLKRIDIEA